MIKLSLEIPTSRLKEWSPLVDLDFILAHKVLDDPEYARHFEGRPAGREVILDNSTHEFGKPLPFQQLHAAAILTKADFVIAPDIVNPVANADREQFLQNIHWIWEAHHHLSEFKLGGVMCGTTSVDRVKWLADTQADLKMVCFSFHIPQRIAWWRDFIINQLYIQHMQRIHLLGMMSVSELREWVKIADKHPSIQFSFDTSKPLKLGVQGIKFTDGLEDQNLRGGPVNSKSVLDMKDFTAEQEKCCIENIEYLRGICHGTI